jgi:hypothetical protein
MSEGSNKIKEELFSLYKGIKDDIPNDKLPINKKNIQNISTLDSITLITYIKESIPLLINQKISEAKTQNNNNEFSIELEENSNLKKEYYQLENQLKKAESDTRYYLKSYLKCEIQKKVLEMKLNAYMCLEEEYEDLKEKVKYEGGKFLDNERKDNEIFILRAENSSLKKEIVKLENINKNKDYKIKEHLKTIKDLQNNVENLNRKIFNLKKIINNNNNINNNEINSKYKTLSKDRNNSMVDLGFNKNNNENIFNKVEYFRKINTKNNYNNDIRNVKSIYPQTFKLKRKINFNSPKSDSMHLENNKNTSNSNMSIHTANTQLLATIYNKINKHNKRNVKIPLVTMLKMKESKYKSLSVNKEAKRTKDDVYKSTNRKIFKNILYYKPKSFSPKSC